MKKKQNKYTILLIIAYGFDSDIYLLKNVTESEKDILFECHNKNLMDTATLSTTSV
jgi:hypothetical protein